MIIACNIYERKFSFKLFAILQVLFPIYKLTLKEKNIRDNFTTSQNMIDTIKKMNFEQKAN